MIRGQHLTHAILAALALASTLAVVWTTGRSPHDERNPNSVRLFSNWREEDIIRIQWHPGASLEKISNAPLPHWQIITPLHERADSVAIEQLLRTLTTTTTVRTLNPDTRSPALGLTPPQLEVTFTLSSGGQYSVKLGNPAPTPPGAHYAEITTPGVATPNLVVLPQEATQALNTSLDTWRERRLISQARSEIREVSVRWASEQWKLQQQQRIFYFQHPWPGRRVGREPAEALFAALSRFVLEQHLDIAQAELALSTSAQRLWLQLVPHQGPPVEFESGGVCPGHAELTVLLRRTPEPRAGCLSVALLTPLRTQATTLQDRSPFSLRADEIEALTLTFGTQELQLERKGAAFTLRGAQTASVELQLGNQRLEDIVSSSGSIVENPDLKALGLNPAAGQARVRSVAATEAEVVEETVLLGARHKGNFYVQRVADNTVLALPGSATHAFRPDSTLLLGRTVLKFTANAWTEIIIAAPGLQQTLRRTANGNPTLEEPAGLPHDATLVADLAQQLGTLDTERWVTDADDGSFGLSPPRLSVQLTLSREKTPYTLLIGSLTPRGAYARLAPNPGVFIAPRSLLSALTIPLFDRSVFMADPTELAQITLESRGHKLTLTAEGEQFRSYPPLLPDALNSVLDTLSTLRAEAAVHTGPPMAHEGFSHPLLQIHLEPKPGHGKQRHFLIGAGDALRDTSIFYARLTSLPITYAIAQSKIRRLLEVF